MLKNKSTHFAVIHKITDLFLINLSWWICYYIRFETKILQADEGQFSWYFKFSILLSLISYYHFRKEGLYSSKRFSPLWEEIISVSRANLVALTIFLVLGYFLSQHKFSRIFLFSYFILSSFLLISFKTCLRHILRVVRKSGRNLRHTLLIGNNHQIVKYADKLTKFPDYGVLIKKWIKKPEDIQSYQFNFNDEPIDSIVIGLENEHHHLTNQILLDLNESLSRIIILPDLSHSFVGYQIVDYAGATAILINEPNIRTRSIILKRIFDIIFSTVAIILISPLLAFIAVLVKLTSKGPVLYSQIRMGLDGKEFKMWKFRSMRTDLSNKETWTVKDDPRVTTIGRIMRKMSLDELPQLLNVLMGDMSLVGPRPERPIYVEQFKKNVHTYMLRHKMKAGITGWAQVNGWRGDTCIEKRIEFDLYYIKNWSIWMDLWIILMTFWKGFIHKNAY